VATPRLIGATSLPLLDRVGPEVSANGHYDHSTFATVLAAAPAHVATSRHQLARWLSNVAVVPSRVPDILLAVSEAVTNAIEHGSRCDASRLVSLQAFVDDRAVTAKISDSGRWIDAAPRPDGPSLRGRGLTLMNGLANSVCIARTAEGTHVTMEFDVS
jgi:anti-sigma regulatory factor (Ser/Thr protein kinase)